ncbi:TPA: RHS repeat-associated core domain-containing protein, partial [Providencia stuartii]
NTQNQLITCFTPSGDVWRYTYDAFGRRLSKTKTVDSEKHNAHPAFPVLKPRVTAWHYLWSGDQMVEEAPVYADGTVAYDAGIQWLYQPGAITPTARYQKGQLHYVVTDHQGTPREIFTEKGIASWAGRLNTWGQMAFWQSQDGRADNDPNYTECHFRFAGQYEDRETGLYYNRFRYYDKDSGQYISPDPIGLLGGLNPYGYVHCPTKYIDPFGLTCCPPQDYTWNDKARRWQDSSGQFVRIAPRDYLDIALSRQGLKAPPSKLKESWLDGEYKMTVRAHPANPDHGYTGSIYRVSRQKVGEGTEYMDVYGGWHKELTLKPFYKDGRANPTYNLDAARDTHIPY